MSMTRSYALVTTTSTSIPLYAHFRRRDAMRCDAACCNYSSLWPLARCLPFYSQQIEIVQSSAALIASHTLIRHSLRRVRHSYQVNGIANTKLFGTLVFFPKRGTLIQSFHVLHIRLNKTFSFFPNSLLMI